MNIPILLVDDEEQALFSYEHALVAEGFDNVTTCADGRAVADRLETLGSCVVLLDLMMPHVSGREILEHIVQTRTDVVTVMLTAVDDVGTAVECMQAGAADYLVKPVQRSRLAATVRAALARCELLHENRSLRRHLIEGRLDHPEAFNRIVTQAPSMHNLFSYVDSIASSSNAVLIRGETGTGKELFARAVHQASGRRGEMVTVNIAGLSDALIADTLFGHVKGAFTGADAAREGLTARAAGGTLFLDEVGDIGPESQVKLLRLLQERLYYPLGSDREHSADVRIVAATSRDLEAMMREGAFRPDLYYRLRTHSFTIPPLRERTDDLPLLLDALLRAAAKDMGTTVPTIPRTLYTLLSNYSFPGNVRELQGIVIDALSRTRGGILPMQPFRERITPGPHTVTAPSDGGASVRFPAVLPRLRDIEPLLIEEALRRTKGNQAQAAELLDVSRKTLNTRVVKARTLNRSCSPTAEHSDRA